MRFSGSVLGVVAGLMFAFQAPPPEGFRTFENKTRGFMLHLPGRFEEIPTPPDQPAILGKFTPKVQQNEGNVFKVKPEVWIISLDKIGVESGEGSSGETDEGSKEKDKGDESGKEKDSGKDKVEKPKKNGVKDFKSWVDSSKVWTAKSDGFIDRGKDGKWERFKLTNKRGAVKGVGYALDEGDHLFCFFGYSDSEIFPEYEKNFEKAAKSLRRIEIKDSQNNELETYYKVHPFRNIDYRKNVRKNMAKGWKADDTENFILIYDCKDEYVVKKAKNDLEAVRAKYLELFPPVKEFTAVSTVRICKDYEEFLKFSQMQPGVRGFFNSKTQELVFYDANGDKTIDDRGRKNTYIVLYHEAFHQYIFYSSDELDPHSWYNEGFGDYFGGSVVGYGGKKVDRIDPNPMRVGRIKAAVQANEYVPLESFVRLEQREYYGNGDTRVAVRNYSQGWSLIYFLVESKLAKAHPAWSKILPTYLATLRSVYQRELASLESKEDADKEAGKMAARLVARKAAVNEAFKDVNFDELEKAWIDFVGKLVDPEAK